MWILIETVDGHEVRQSFKSAEEAALFVLKGGAHNFPWVENKVIYTIRFEEG